MIKQLGGVARCRAARLAPWLAALLLAGCEAVFTPRPLGDAAVALDPAEWQATWVGPDMVITTTVLDAEAGVLQAAWIERGTQGATLEVVEGSIRATGEWTFANILDEKQGGDQADGEVRGEVAAAALESAPGPRFTWVRLEKRDRHLTVWSPNVEQFKRFVGDGRLPGEVTDDGVVLGELTEAQVRMINDPASNLLNWADPGMFVRIAD